VLLEPGERDESSNVVLVKTERWGDGGKFEVRKRNARLGTTGYVEEQTTTLVEKSREPS
jgi:hypothetical protein